MILSKHWLCSGLLATIVDKDLVHIRDGSAQVSITLVHANIGPVARQFRDIITPIALQYAFVPLQ